MKRSMNRRWILLAVITIQLTSLSTAWAMGGTYGKGDPKHPVSTSAWPTQITVLANRTDRISGFWVNGSDTFNYKGNTKALNQFLAQYARTPGITPMVILQQGDGISVSPFSKEALPVNYDWQLQTLSWGSFSSSVRVPINGTIALKDIKIPDNVQVDFLGSTEQPTEVKQFLADHNRRQQLLRD